MMLEYRVLGPLVVRRDGMPVDPGSPKQRAVLAALLLARGAVVSTDRLVHAVWGDDPPAAVATSLQAYISNLRRLLRDASGASPIERVSPGYRLAVGQDRFDLLEFGRLAGEARDAVDAFDWETALSASTAALALWRGPLLEEFEDRDWIEVESTAPTELRRAATEAQIAALLAHGDVATALVAATELCRQDPLRERSVWLRMVALYRDGRAGSALEAYAAYVRDLDVELGLDPSAELRELQGAVLRHDPELAAWPLTPRWTGARPVSSPEPRAVQPVETQELAGEVARDIGAPLVGREDAVRVLRELRTAGTGTRWLILSGPAGIGKTRLAEEAVHLAEAAGDRAVWVRCPDTEGVPAWWPLRQLCRALNADTDLLTVSDGADADAARFEVYDRVQALLEHESATKPLTIVVDDVQWADAMSLGLLRYLAPVLRDAPVTVVLTLREEEATDAAQSLREAVARSGGRLLDVPELSREAVGELVRAVADTDLSAAELDQLVARTGGNPLYVTEYARLPEEQRRDVIPAAVRSVLGRRLATLDPTVREVIGHAAVIGEEIDIAMLSELTSRSVDAVADCLDEAADERIVVPLPSSGGLTFAHALLRDEAETMFAPLRRCRIHLRAAELLAARSGPEMSARRAAHLLDALPVAEVPDVVAACREAAHDAAVRWDSESAAHWLSRALRTHETLAGPEASVDERDALLTGMLHAQVRAGRAQLVLDTVEAMLVRAMRDGSTVTVGRLAGVLLRAGGGWPWISPTAETGSLHEVLTAAVDIVDGDSIALVRVLGALAIGHCYHRDASVPAGLLERAAEVAAAVGDPDVMADAILARLITYSGVSGRAAELISLADDLTALPHADAELDEVIAGSVVTMAAMTLGDIPQTKARLRAAIAGSERMRLPVLRAQLRWMEAALAVWHGDFALAEEHFRTALAVHRQTELYVAGSGALALMATANQRGVFDDVVDEVLGTGGGDRMEWVRTVMSAAPDNRVSTLLAAGVATVAVEHGDAALVQSMIDLWRADDRPMIWTSLAQAVVLANLVVEERFVDDARAFIDVLAPYAGHIATVGQVGCVGPVDLALAGLYDLIGDDAAADAALGRARALSIAGDSRPGLLRCRLFEALRAPDSADRAREIAAIAAQARALGLQAVVDVAHAAERRTSVPRAVQEGCKRTE
ncbi:putative regulatory protein [Gordonia sihwensis NBRC 108236]|uniref:Putative regulatory protein n=2 Tax=Gordoniaceae TaxID=85026 RepID=L7LKH7_9ACTN|nr:putative regulatory protein [Gordonia sihwensis NBRC 108236]